MTFPRRLNTTQRRILYEDAVKAARAAGREHPACNLCPHPIEPGQSWDESHDPQKPRWLCDEPASEIAHSRCNRIWNNRHDTPLYAKSNRQRDKFRDIKRSRNPLPGGKDDPRRRTVAGEVVDRETGERWGTQ
jgi:hypothetical protein